LNVGDSLKAYGKWLGSGLIVVHAETEMNDRVGILEQTTGAVRWLIDDQGRSIEYVIPSHDGRTFAIIDFKRGQLHASEFDVETRTERPIAVAGSSLLPVDCLPSGCWICELYCSTAPHELVEFIPETAETRTLTHARDHLPSAEMPYAQAKPWNWKSSDGMEIDGWLYEPKGPSRGLIVDIHGGPTWHREDWIETEIQFLVAAGFSVLDPNYRGSTGYGRPFREAIKQDGWGGREQADIRTGIESLITADKAKRGRIGVVGLSYGGYSSWYQLVKAPDLIAAAAPICGMYHLTIDYDETGMPHGRAYSEEMMGGPPEEEPQRYFEASPANFIDQIKGRLLIVHGLRDSNVSPENSFAASRDLTRANVAYELLTFPNEGHGIHRASNRDALFRKLADFFGKAFA